jgi:hypothetical protein
VGNGPKFICLSSNVRCPCWCRGRQGLVKAEACREFFEFIKFRLVESPELAPKIVSKSSGTEQIVDLSGTVRETEFLWRRRKGGCWRG